MTMVNAGEMMKRLEKIPTGWIIGYVRYLHSLKGESFVTAKELELMDMDRDWAINVLGHSGYAETVDFVESWEMESGDIKVERIGSVMICDVFGHVFYAIFTESERVALRVFEREIGWGRCSHEHDACGCWIGNHPEILQQSFVAGYLVLRQTVSRNV